jgi:Type II secretion system (T2SS), protein G
MSGARFVVCRANLCPMQRQAKRSCSRRRALCLLLVTVFICAPLSAAEKTLSKKVAQQAIMRIGGLALKKSAVQIKQVSGTSAPVEVSAAVKTAFHCKRRGDGSWQAVEVRVGDRQWEEIDLLTRAWHVEPTPPLIAQLEALAAQLEARERARAAEKQRQKEAAKAADKKQRKQKQRPTVNEPNDLRIGPFVGKGFSALLSSATVEVELDTSFRLNRDAQGQWQATEARIGDGAWVDVAALVHALDTEKTMRARAELDQLAAALRAFRRERGFYIVADTSAALVDQLNPRYLSTIIRIDPWHRPYEYTGAPDSFTLRSLGPDGKAETADDVVINSAGP